MVNCESASIGLNSQPTTPTDGLISKQENGTWKLLCVSRWDNGYNEQFCWYVHKRA